MNELIEELKSERLKQGLSLQTISNRTRISVSMLQNLEEGDFKGIGTALLIRSFLRSYCSALGIDPQPFLERYHTKIAACDLQQDGINRYGIWSKPPRSATRTKILIILSTGTVLLGALIGWAWYYNWKARMADSQLINGNMYSQQDIPPDLAKRAPLSRESGIAGERTSESQDQLEIPSQPHQPVNGGESPVSGTAQGVMVPVLEGNRNGESHAVKPATSGDQSEVHHFEIKTNRRVWVKLTVDGGTPQDVLLKPGSSRTWEVKDSVVVEAKSKRGISLKWDGKAVDLPGAVGRPLRFSLPNQDGIPF